MFIRRNRKLLLEIAREAYRAHITDGQTPPAGGRDESASPGQPRAVSSASRSMASFAAASATLPRTRPLYQLVQEMAVSAATRDPRFYPMRKRGPRQFQPGNLRSLPPSKDHRSIEEIRGRRSRPLYLKRTSPAGVLLPQVAVEYRLGPGNLSQPDQPQGRAEA